jgi:hypothetical protein
MSELDLYHSEKLDPDLDPHLIEKLDPDLLQTGADPQQCLCDYRLRMFRVRSGHVREQGGEGGEPLTAHGSGGRNRSSNSGACSLLYLSPVPGTKKDDRRLYVEALVVKSAFKKRYRI